MSDKYTQVNAIRASLFAMIQAKMYQRNLKVGVVGEVNSILDEIIEDLKEQEVGEKYDINSLIV